MPTWYFDERDTGNSPTGPNNPTIDYERINLGRSEVNTRFANPREGGLRIENEDGIELWFSVTGDSNDGLGVLSWIDDVDDRTNGELFNERVNPSSTDDGNLYYQAQQSDDQPKTDPDPDVFLIAPYRNDLDGDGNYDSDRDVNGDYTGRLVSTDTDPLTIDFKTGSGIWQVTFHKADGTTETVNVGDDDRRDTPDSNGQFPLLDWKPGDLDGTPTIAEAPPGEYTHITIHSLTVATASNSASFIIDTISMDSFYCFLHGTLIETVDGPRPVEHLKEGDLLRTADGGTTPVVWGGQKHVMTPCVDPEAAYPIRITAGALAPNTPSRDLYVSPDHAIFIDGMLFNASTLVNGTTIRQVDRMPMTGFTYYHIETRAHDLILAEGCPAETFVDFNDRKSFDNVADYHARFGATRLIHEMPYPRISSQRLVPRAIRSKLGITKQDRSRSRLDMSTLEPVFEEVEPLKAAS